MQAVYVIANRHKDQGLRCAREMVQRLHERKIQVYAPDEIAAELGVQTAAFSQEEGCEAAFVLGDNPARSATAIHPPDPYGRAEFGQPGLFNRGQPGRYAGNCGQGAGPCVFRRIPYDADGSY